MEYIVKFAEGFIKLFQTGADTFIDWMITIVPLVLMLLIAMNTLIQLIGEKRINTIAKKSAGNPFLRYLVLPFLGSFMLANPMVHSLGRFMPEKYKPSYFASASQFAHTSNGLFPHINPAELFIFLGIANGISKLHLPTTDLAVRYLLVGLILNFIGGWITDFTTSFVEKQQGIKLSKEVHLEGK